MTVITFAGSRDLSTATRGFSPECATAVFCFGELTPLSCRADGGQKRMRDEVQEAGQSVRHGTEVTSHLRGNGFRTAMQTIVFAVVVQPLMARQLNTVCFPAESFLLFPFSLQLLPFSAWFSQNGSGGKQGRGKAGSNQSPSAPFSFLLKLALLLELNLS